MSDVVAYEPDILIVEKVERQLPTLGKVPPIMHAPVRDMCKPCVSVDSSAATVRLSREGSYWKLEGGADAAFMHTDSHIYVEVDDGSGAVLYEAFCVNSSDGDNGGTNDYGYVLYVSEVLVTGDTFQIRVMTEQEEAMVILLKEELTLNADKTKKENQGQPVAQPVSRTAEQPKSEATTETLPKPTDQPETKAADSGEQTVQPEGEAAGSAKPAVQPGSKTADSAKPET